MSDFLKVLGVVLGGLIAAVGFFFLGTENELMYLLGIEDSAWILSAIWWVSGIVTGSIIYALGLILEVVQDIKKDQTKAVRINAGTTENV
ncbi:hypothetical protein NYE54_09355 [Paenibacillus sp. FSL K6-1330]|uniref:hypothetical protein n=1 Tax=Paenibacillus sp. FSL K6-1330 TaxID=2975292 RepID=UPI0030D7A9BC